MSDTKIDHAAEAMALRTRASTPDHPSHHANLLAAAQVHATLALVEQQRIANLIAIHSGNLDILAEINPDHTKRTRDENDRRWRNMRATREQIREGLGIA